MDYTSKPVLTAGAALLFAACALEVEGQQMRNAEQSSRERMATEAAESEEREMMLWWSERFHRSGQRRDPRLAFAQIRQDFLRLQVVNNDLARAVSGGGQLEFKLVTKSASEIRKLAQRLRDNLALPEAEDNDKTPAASAPAEPEQLKAALSVMDKIILRFAGDLHSKGVRSFDPQLSVRMRRDLEAIIALSGRVQKCSEKLGMATR